MENSSSRENILTQINQFKRKYYMSQLIKGLAVSFSVTIGAFLFISFTEYLGNFSTATRAILFFSYLALSIFFIYRYILRPLNHFLNKRKQLPDEQAAQYIGNYFPGISDRLLNFIQLSKKSGDNALIQASINQKATRLSKFDFTQAVDLRQNRQYLKYLGGVVLLFIVIGLFDPSVISIGGSRVINYNTTYTPVSPFDFNLEENYLTAYKNEDHTLELKLSGESIPEEVFLVNNGRRVKMKTSGLGEFSYTFFKIQSDKRFYFEAAGFSSMTYSLNVVSRPNLRNFAVELNYPTYLSKDPDRLNNIGNLEVPEGTSIKWIFNTLETNNLSISFPDTVLEAASSTNNLFEIDKSVSASQEYEINLTNEKASNKDKIGYYINVVPDQYPKINVNIYQDTILFNYIVLGGNVSDDYGISGLRLFYQKTEESQTDESNWESIPLPFNAQQINQSYFYRWDVDSLLIDKGEKLNYYLAVYDNDGYNGVKSSKTGIYNFEIPTDEELKAEIATSSEKTESDIEKSLEEAKDLKESIDDLQNRLKGKKELGWQEQKMLEELAKKREELNKSLEELQKQFENEKNKRERFEEYDESLNQKAEEIKKLMEELLDEETMKMYEELMKLLEDETENRKIQEMLDKINNKEENLEKELERTLELFKRMKFEYKLEESIQELDNLIEEQQELNEETENSKKGELSEMAEQQEELQEKFEEFQKQMDELNELNQEMERSESMQDFSEQEEQIQQEMENAKEQLQQNNKKKAGESQQNSQKQMQKMNQELQQMQSSMEMQMMQANLDNLRDILQNLITLSFNQEDLMKEFRGVDQSDPRFVELGQKQLKIKDDAEIVEDSLLSLANRVFQLQAFVTREVQEMNNHLENSIDAIRERTKAKAVTEQQFAMTSMNNLALMLDDVLSSMQQNMSDAMGKNNKNGDMKVPSLSELQEQLNQRIQELKQSGKSGRELSEELAKLAAEQERIRKALQEMEEKFGEGDGESAEQLMKEMEETEEDIVNKRLSGELIERQRDILTRLLEAENSMRERELDKEREGETAKEYDSIAPGAFEEYFKAKEKEVELLKTVPPKLYPYYKKEVDEYFKRIGTKTIDR